MSEYEDKSAEIIASIVDTLKLLTDRVLSLEARIEQLEGENNVNG